MYTRCLINYDKDNTFPMLLFDKIRTYSGVRPYLHNVSSGIIGAEITNGSIEDINGLSGILKLEEDSLQ